MELLTAVFLFIFIRVSNQYSMPDWLLTDIGIKTQLRKLPGGEIELTNGLISRRFSTTPGFATVDYYSHEKKSSLIRAIQPEAIVKLDGIAYNVGGFKTEGMSRAYLNRTALGESAKRDEKALKFERFETAQIKAKFPYKGGQRGAPRNLKWPPKGLHLKLYFKYRDDTWIIINYEMFDNVPFLTKWISVMAKGAAVRLSIDAIEILSLNWQWAKQGYGWMQVVPELPRGTDIQWITEPNHELGSFQPLLKCAYDKNFSVSLQSGDKFESFKVIQVLVGSSDSERKGLALRRLKRLLAPQSQENPIYFHMTNGSSLAFRNVVDQLAEVGFEMIFYSFGSGFDLEAKDLSQLKSDIAYANKKGLEVGGYDLIAWTRKVDAKWLALTNETAPSACMASGWYDFLLGKVRRIRNEANLTAIETDGPYSGYSCAATNHKYHHDEHDSTYHQSRLQTEFYAKLHEMGMYINQPDDYFFYGANKAAMGYNEGQFSLPRWVDLSVSRQGMFDDTFQRIPSEGWMFLPLVNYEGGGPAAWFEPLSQHLTEFDFALAQYFGAGVQACYRGDRIFDGQETKAIVKKWIAFYKKYRHILNGDLIHVRRADMQSLDIYMHVQPLHSGPVKGLVMIFNPTDELINEEIELPLYYTGLETKARLLIEGDPTQSQLRYLNRAYDISLEVILKGKSYIWLVIEEDA